MLVVGYSLRLGQRRNILLLRLFISICFCQHGWGLPEGVEPPIIRNPLLDWLLLPLAPSAIPMRVGAGAGSSENSKEGAIFNSVTVRQRLEYTKLWVMWAI
jgi:hypothetical protein